MIQIPILFVDEHIIVINKPSGILSIPDRYHLDKPNVLNELKLKYDSVMVVHRLDKDTSGLMIFALHEEAHSLLNLDFLNRKIDKFYHALVDGVLIENVGEINESIVADRSTPGKMKVAKNGKKSITTFQVLERFNASSYVQAQILTGRMHQVRVHFKHIGYPLLVDKIYGNRENIFIDEIKIKKLNKSKNEEFPLVPLMSRVSLHAQKLQFTHPMTNEVLSFEADLPKDFKATLNQLRKWSKRK